MQKTYRLEIKLAKARSVLITHHLLSVINYISKFSSTLHNQTYTNF